VYWQYRTILFEYQKDGLLGDKYVDDEEVEKVLNELGEEGWELVSVTAVQEGLLTFFKRGRPQSLDQQSTKEQPAVPRPPLLKRPVAVAAPSAGRALPGEEQQTLAPRKKSTMIDEIKIS